MSLRVVVFGEAKSWRFGAGAKASPKRAYSRMLQTRNRVIYAWAGWRQGNTCWRSEPVSVEKLSDDLCVGVKGQSNSEIARTPRNAFRCSLGGKSDGGRATDRVRGLRRLSSPDELRMPSDANREWGRGC